MHKADAMSESFVYLATRASVMRRAAKIALVVGVVLAAINHGDRILSGTLDSGGVFKILLTFCVPYCVSTYSSVLAIRERSQWHDNERGAYDWAQRNGILQECCAHMPKNAAHARGKSNCTRTAHGITQATE